MIDIIFHYKDELSFRKKVRGELRKAMFSLHLKICLIVWFCFSGLPVYSQAESILAEIFPCVVGFGAVKDR